MNENDISRVNVEDSGEGRGSLAGLVLAGGVGSRYGGPKAWAKLPDGRSFLEACVAVLLGGGANPVLATLPPGASEPGIEGLRALPLPEDGLDMFASLGLGLAVLVEERRWTRVAVLAVDHPLVRPETVAALASASGPATVPVHRSRRGHPVLLDRPLAEEIVGGRRSGPTLRDILHEVGWKEVPVDDLGTIANCNTPDALARALATANRVR
ncbi:MAG: NTP transferase domain-containing protein [Thermoanaerobaculales bacterium]|jgi:CTP:molybdopterin cytidylyltransferase MocA|nr:NTP transferase domain-containing protein [Thermoanaerobaculales bacterium]